MDFRLVERLKLQSLSGETARLDGQTVFIQQKVTARGKNVLGDINIVGRGNRSARNEFSATVQIGFGKILVLCQRGLEEKDNAFYIVQADSESGTNY